MTVLASAAPLAASQQLGVTLLNGSAPCVWSTGGDIYEYPFTAFFDPAHSAYGWEVSSSSSRGGSVATAQGLDGALLRLGRRSDVYDVPYGLLDDSIEVGWAKWLVLPEATRTSVPSTPGEWTSRAFVGTRVSTTNTTFCGCQFMHGDARRFHLTEHGRAHLVEPNLHLVGPPPDKDGTRPPPWYLGRTRSDINELIERTCRPYAERLGCPADNATAYRQWREGDPNWVVVPWVEVYSEMPRAGGGRR